jgi:hypothetical protein
MRITAELLDDAHPGSGAGGGGVDALVARDRHGQPVIWASHLEGVLRDAARRLRGYGVAADFFGRAGGQRQRALFTSLYAAAAPTSRVWRSSARRAFDNRAPNDDTLRVVEHVPKGTTFEGCVELPGSDVDLLRRLLQEIDALGSGRASGVGRVKLSSVEEKPAPRAIGSATERLILLLYSRDPLCITATATPTNLIPSMAFVPGRALLGALASWLIAEGHTDAAASLVAGRLAVSDALPAPGAPKQLSAAEILPAPLSLQSEKPPGTAGAVPWWAQPPVAARRLDRNNQAPQGPPLKRPEDDLFVYRANPREPWTTLRPELRVRLRNGRPDPDQADPSLFAIEQIVEETHFLGEIRGELADMQRFAADLKPVLDGSRWLRIGRGGAPVEVAAIEWAEAPPPPPSLPRAILTLTSDLLVRDEYLRWCISLDDARFGSLPDWPSDVTVKPVAQESVAVHGFNGTSQLWRMPAFGVRRGSVFEVEGMGVAELARMRSDGRWLGERTHEGFGRFRLDATLPGVSTGGSGAATAPAAASDAADEAVAATTRQWFEQHRALADAGGAADRRPSLSQWLDLVADLERDNPDALTGRQNPTTAGGRSWAHPDARAVLQELANVRGHEMRVSHARLFVRWLRAKMRGRTA